MFVLQNSTKKLEILIFLTENKLIKQRGVLEKTKGLARMLVTHATRRVSHISAINPILHGLFQAGSTWGRGGGGGQRPFSLKQLKLLQ